MGAKIDLSGQKFGRLTVIKENGRDASNKIMWLCKCDCGNEKTIRGNDLRSGKILSCGCYQQEKSHEERPYLSSKKPKPKIDLTGKTYGYLTVICLDEDYTLEKRKTSKTNPGIWWKCQCKCGNEIRVKTAELNNGHVKSCGCLQKELASANMKNTIQKLGADARFIDLTGQKFGKLTVIKRDSEKQSAQIFWICQCECGNVKSINGSSLKSNATQSCGCIGNSLGENKIKDLLLSNNINFIQEVKFPNLKDKSYLRFDFAILDENNQIIKLIEYDGRQHFDTNSIWHTDTVILHDKMKDDYCQEHKIPLIRIPYTQLENLSIQDLI